MESANKRLDVFEDSQDFFNNIKSTIEKHLSDMKKTVNNISQLRGILLIIYFYSTSTRFFWGSIPGPHR